MLLDTGTRDKYLVRIYTGGNLLYRLISQFVSLRISGYPNLIKRIF